MYVVWQWDYLGSRRVKSLFCSSCDASHHQVLFSGPFSCRIVLSSRVNVSGSFVFLAGHFWIQLPLAVVDSWTSVGPQQRQVKRLLQPQAATLTLISKLTVWQRKSQGPHHLCHCYVPPSLSPLPGPFLLIPLAMRFQLSLLSFGLFSTWCGPLWFLPQHLYHSVSLVAGQTVVTERRGCLVTVGINRPQVRNAVNQETARRLLRELEAFDSNPELNVAVLHGIGKRRNAWEWAFLIGWSLIGTLIRQANQQDLSYLFFICSFIFLIV